MSCIIVISRIKKTFAEECSVATAVSLESSSVMRRLLKDIGGQDNLTMIVNGCRSLILFSDFLKQS